MVNSDLTTEHLILEAVEAEFLEKGYGNAKMMAIAKRAGVSHSMLHYYFRSKENLFQKIFQQKVQSLSQMFEGISMQNLPFIESIKLFVEYQFDFIAQNPRLPLFMINEIITNRENLNLLIEVVRPQITEILDSFEKQLNEEIAKGLVRPVNFLQLLINIISMNVSSFLPLQVLEVIIPNFDDAAKQSFLNERRKSNAEFIVNALRP